MKNTTLKHPLKLFKVLAPKSNGIQIPLTVFLTIIIATLLYYRGIPFCQWLGVTLFLIGGWIVGKDISLNIEFYKGSILTLFKKEDCIFHTIIGVITACGGYIAYQLFCRIAYGRFLNLEWNLPIPIFLLVITIAFSEELFFRGYLQVRLSEAMNLWSRIFLVSVFVMIYKLSIHLTNINFIKAIEIGGVSFVGSIWVGYLLDKYRTLISPTLFHIVWDILVYSPYSKMPYWLF